MTLIEKDGLTDYKDTPWVTEEAARSEYGSGPVPPTYAEALDGQQVPSTSRGPRHPGATNFTSIHYKNDKIGSHFIIDTSLDVPEALLAPLPTGATQRPNLSLHSNNGSVRADVSLVAGSAQRANLELDTANGKIMFKLTSRANRQPFKLKATTRNGSIIIALPQDFIGPLQFSTRNGKIKVSDELQRVFVTFTDKTAFIGDWQAAGFSDFAKWEGDEVEAETVNGKIVFCYAGDQRVDREEFEPMPEFREKDRQSKERDRHSRQQPQCEGSRLKKGGGWWGRR